MTDLVLHWHAQLMDADRIPSALAAITLTAILGMITGPLAGNANPLLWLAVDKVFGGFGDRLDRLSRPRADLLSRGFLLTAVVILVALALGRALAGYLEAQPAFGINEILILSALITTGAVWFALLRLYFAIEKQEVGQGAYYAVSRSARTNLALSDDFGITRAGMGYAARSFDKGLVAPVFWYLVGGLPLAMVYAVLAALSWRFGKDGFTKGFGAVPLALERLLGFAPAILSAALIALAGGLTPTASMFQGFRSWLGHKGRAPYEQGGLPLSALAWALNVSLGGATQDLSGSALKGAWTGPESATARNDHHHLRRALYINVTAHILFMAALLGAYVWSGRAF